MHIVRQTAQELVVVASSRWVAAICAAGALFCIYAAVARSQMNALFVAGFFTLCALIMDLRKTFIFDGSTRMVRWNGCKVFKAESGVIPFAEITDIGTQASLAGSRNIPTYRLTIVTTRAIIPMAYTYNGQPDHYAKLRGHILDFLRARSAIEQSKL